MSNPISSYNDKRLQGSSLVEPFQKAYKRLSNFENYIDPTRDKTSAIALAVLKMIADIFVIIFTSPFALIGRCIQIAHYNSLTQVERENPDSLDSIPLDTPCSVALKRIGNHCFILKGNNEKEIILTTPEDIKPKTSFKLAQSVARQIEKGLDKLSNFTMEFINWKISEGSKGNLPGIIKAILNSFIHEDGNDGVLRLHVSKESWASYKGKKPKCIVDQPDYAPKLNPFKRLAKIAHQELEPNFAVPDYFTPEDTQYVIIKDENGFALRARKSLTDADLPAVKKAIRSFRKHMIREVGEEKLKYIEHHYRCPLQENVQLTPEHIYRMNIGAENIEFYDVAAFLTKINYGGPLTAREERALKKIDPFQFSGKTDPSQLTPAEFANLMEALSCTEEEWEDIFSGRMPYEQTISGYPEIYGKSEYKPWVDQQELLRLYPLLQKKIYKKASLNSEVQVPSWKLFYEKCVFTICKMHLMKEHPTEGLRVGSLIPAPKNENGESRWYMVSRVDNNGFGILSYTLESPCGDSTLPRIELFRSTASSDSAIDNLASMHNNTNPLNSPGYENIGNIDKYKKDSLKEVTVPIWVLYMEEAKNLLKQNDDALLPHAFEMLQKANDAIYEAEVEPLQPKNLKEILRSHDGLLNELYADRINLLGSIFNLSDPEHKYTSLYCEFLDKYIHTKTYPSREDEVADAKRLIEVLQNLPHIHSTEYGPQLHHKEYGPKIASLIDDLTQNIIEPVQYGDKKAFQDFYDSTFACLENQTWLYGMEETSEEKRKSLQDWVKYLNDYAESQGENISQKKQNDLVFTGHSLGGASAQAQACHFLSKSHRVALPNHKVMVKLYDAPKINREDNTAFKNQILKHRDILKKFNITTEVHHNAEVNDFFSLGGEERLGAVKSEEEMAELSSHLKVKATLRERLPDAKEPTIREMPFAHGTQFAQGIQGVDFLKWKYKAHEMRQLDKNSYKYSIVQERLKIPKLFGFFVTAKNGNKMMQHPSLLMLVRRSLKQGVHYRYPHLRDENRALCVTVKGGVLSKPITATA